MKRVVGLFLLSMQLVAFAQSHVGTPAPAAVNSNNDPELKARLDALNRDIASKGLHTLPGRSETLLTGYAYGEFFDWDLYFENIYLSYYGVSDYTVTNFKVFLDRQQPDGFVSRTIGITYPRPKQMFKPFLAQIAVLGSKQRGNDYEWLRDDYYGRLQRYIDRWFQYDTDHNGLPVWNSSDASGMDNQTTRAGDLDTFQDEGVDLACELVRELRAMAYISMKLHKNTEAREYTRHAEALSSKINQILWDEKDGFYYDRNEKTGRRVKVKSVAGFLPLWAGVASPAQAKRLIYEHLLNPKEFWMKYPVASYARTEPDFYEGSKAGESNWRGPAWIPLNYMIFHGLIDYGYPQIAATLASKTLDMAMNQNSVTREFYDSDTGHGNGMDPFWGWSSLAYVMPLEQKDHYNPMSFTQPIRPIVLDELGIKFPSIDAPTPISATK